MGIAVFPAAGGGVTQKVQEFTSTGTFTVPSNCSAVEVFLVGGGGGGGFALTSVADNLASAGGGGGAVIKRTISVTPGTAYTVTIGAGGAGSTSAGSAGGTGGDTTFGSLATAKGGGGGGSRDNQSGTSASAGKGGGTLTAFASGLAGCGGGALNSSRYNGMLSGNASQYQFGTNVLNGSSYAMNSGSAGYTGSTNSVIIAGEGIDGYGNGGASGFQVNPTSPASSRSTPVFSGTGRPTYWDVNGGSITAGISASANTGDGGHGGITTQTTSNSTNGLSGGSGFARIIYWS